jgi:hypothetical protein
MVNSLHMRRVIAITQTEKSTPQPGKDLTPKLVDFQFEKLLWDEVKGLLAI